MLSYNAKKGIYFDSKFRDPESSSFEKKDHIISGFCIKDKSEVPVHGMEHFSLSSRPDCARISPDITLY